MEHVLDNLRLLKNDMELKGWVIDSFSFRYKNQNYIVLVKLLSDKNKHSKYALLSLEFIKEDNFKDKLITDANTNRLIIDAKILRKYFNIDYGKNLGNILFQFYEHLANFIPEKVEDNKTEQQKSAMCNSLSNSDSEDPRKIYCFAVKRNGRKNNGQLKQRSLYNDNKTRLLRPELYVILQKDTNLSFVYSLIKNEEKTDIEIISNWNRNQNI